MLVWGLCLAAGPALAADWFVATNGSDAAAGTNWATAKLTIQAGVDAAADGDTVWVGSGSFQEGLTISDGIRLASTNGPHTTTIRGNGERCITITHSNAVVSGFTITGGRNQNGAGVYMSQPGARVENCIITNNGATASNNDPFWRGTLVLYGGGIMGGQARNCLIASNFLRVTTAGRYCTSDASGAGTDDCRLENCTVVNNDASVAGYYEYAWGGCHGGTTTNCIIVFNPGTTSWNGSFDSSNMGDPIFADSSFHLSASSPCINAGTNQDWMVGATDLDSNLRIYNSIVDIGCYEYGSRPPYLDAPVLVEPVTVVGGGIGLWRSTNDTVWVVGTKPTNAWVAISTNTPDVYVTNGVFQDATGTVWSNLLVRNWNPPEEIKTWHFQCEPVAANMRASAQTTLRGTAAGLCGVPVIWIVSSVATTRQAQCSLSGNRNLQTLEHMWVSNQANGATANFTAPLLPATNWMAPALPLALGTNILYAFGTNLLGDVAMAQHAVYLECHVGSAGMGSNGAVRVEWVLSTDSSITNQWQRTTNLLTGVWTNLGAPFVATQEVECLIESNFNGVPAFFRMLRTGD